MCTLFTGREGRVTATRWPFHLPHSQPPAVPTKACPPVRVDAFITVLSLLAVGSGLGQSKQQCLDS